MALGSHSKEVFSRNHQTWRTGHILSVISQASSSHHSQTHQTMGSAYPPALGPLSSDVVTVLAGFPA